MANSYNTIYIFKKDTEAQVTEVEYLDNGAVKVKKNGLKCVYSQTVFDELYEEIEG